MTFPFQSTRPLRGATGICLAFFKIELFQSTRPLRGATVWCNFLLTVMDISIHAPLAGRDGKYVRCGAVLVNISIHAPLAGRDGGLTMADYIERISIHAPLAGRDAPAMLIEYGFHTFQSTRPLRGATSRKLTLSCFWIFQSTRPLRGATPWCGTLPPGNIYFNPRAPCGARLLTVMLSTSGCVFQSTRPLRGATPTAGAQRQGTGISIHAPLAGRDKERFITAGPPEFQSTRPLRGATCISACGRPGGKHFNPRAPCGARPGKTVQVSVAASISIHAPLAGRDLSLCALPSSTRNFNPRAPCGARRRLIPRGSWRSYFNPRAPCGARPLQA